MFKLLLLIAVLFALAVKAWRYSLQRLRAECDADFSTLCHDSMLNTTLTTGRRTTP